MNKNCKPDHIHISDFMSTGKFKEGTKFWKSERVDSKGAHQHWNYTCPICSHDEYVKAGLCSGVFESASTHLKRGKISCRCSSFYRWTKDQYAYRIKKKMDESGTADVFIRICSNFKNSKSKFIRKCSRHGRYETSISDYCSYNIGCPICGCRDQKEAYINIIKKGDEVVALKFGIAKNSKQRIKNQDRRSEFQIEQYGVWLFQKINACKIAENHVRKSIKCRLLSKEQMPDGYTETTSADNLEAITKIYEKYGGVKKNF